ncbi:MAG TPA: metal-dependent hydrolase [Iamia sp.]|nr:metal-dependent hydrolase [Iamia sp.]
MSWAAHELESYVIGDHVKAKISYLAVLIGCLAPDMLTKLPVYGVHLGPISFEPAKEPWAYHRGWPGVGPTHGLLFGVLVGLLVLWLTKNRAWALGLVIGQWAHALTDICDSVGTMLFFPFTTQHYTVGMWAYAAQAGKFGDADAYYSSLGGVWDTLWLVFVLFGWRALTREFFFTRIVADDPVWGWLRRRFRLSNRAMLALYRAYFCYGLTRIIAWTGIARLRSKAPIDWTWGGPSFVEKAPSSWPGWGDFLLNSLRGAVLFALAGYVVWRLIGRRLWERAEPSDPTPAPA